MSSAHDLALNDGRKVSAGRPGPLHRFPDLSVRYAETSLRGPSLLAVSPPPLAAAPHFALVPAAHPGGAPAGTRASLKGLRPVGAHPAA